MKMCPFWSTTKEKVDCYGECPMIIDELVQGKEEEYCVFKECELSSRMNFKDILNEEYNFLNISIYDDKDKNANY